MTNQRNLNGKDQPSRFDLSIYGESAKVFSTVWRRRQRKVHKTWDGDGFVISTSTSTVFLNDEYSEIHRLKSGMKTPLQVGSSMFFGNNEYEIINVLDQKTFIGNQLSRESSRIDDQKNGHPVIVSGRGIIKRGFKPCFVGCQSSRFPGGKRIWGPAHNPATPDAFIISEGGLNKVEIVADPILSRHLCPHQRDGVKFLYSCLMDAQNIAENSRGAILADEMGLGKTLQAITLIWTLLKQSPLPTSSQTIKRCLVVCPASLVTYWKKEFNKVFLTFINFIVDRRN
jgi:DNA repair and recombination protein RAD54B